MNNKSQFYLFAAIILTSLVFLIVSNSKIVDSQNFKKSEDLFENYKYEATIVVNNAIYANKNITKELSNFTEHFIEFGDSRNIDIKILALYSYQDNIYIVNYLNQPVLISGSIVGEEESIAVSSSEIDVNYNNETYSFTFDLGKPEVKVLFIGE